MGPFLPWIIQHPYSNHDSFFYRVTELSVISYVQKTHNYLFPLKTLAFTLLSPFAVFGMDDRFGLAGVPLFDRLTSGLFFIGLVLAVRIWRERPSQILILGLMATLPANAMAALGDKPSQDYVNGQRLFCLLPFVFWGVAYGLNALVGWVNGCDLMIKKIGIFLGCIAILAAASWNSYIFYHDFPRKGLWGELGFRQITIAEIIREYSANSDLFIHWEVNSSVVQFLDRDCPYKQVNEVNSLDKNNLNQDKPGTDLVRPRVVLVTNDDDGVIFKQALLKSYPNVKTREFRDREDQIFLWAFELPHKRNKISK